MEERISGSEAAMLYGRLERERRATLSASEQRPGGQMAEDQLTPLEYAKWVIELEEETVRLGWPEERRTRPAVLAMARELVRLSEPAGEG